MPTKPTIRIEFLRFLSRELNFLKWSWLAGMFEVVARYAHKPQRLEML